MKMDRLAGFSITEQGAFFGNGAKREWLCQPFKTRPMCVGDEDRDGGWGELVSFEAQDGTPCEAFVSAVDLHLHPYKTVTRLIGLGMRISNSQKAHLKFVEFLSVYDNEEVA